MHIEPLFNFTKKSPPKDSWFKKNKDSIFCAVVVFAGASFFATGMFFIFQRNSISDNVWRERSDIISALHLPKSQIEESLKKINPELKTTKTSDSTTYEVHRVYKDKFIDNFVLRVNDKEKVVVLQDTPLEYLEERVSRFKSMMNNVSRVTIDYKRSTATVTIIEEL